MKRVVALAALWLVPAGIAQSPRLEFEVAAIKQSTATDRSGGIRMMPGTQRYVGTNVSLKVMMTVAYSVTDRQISGGPAWVDNDRFDLEARAAQSMSTDDLHTMLAHLLEDRFALKLRRETREMPVLLLTQDKGGSKLPVHDPADHDYPPFSFGGRGKIKGTNVTSTFFAFFLSRILDRNVLDRTGLPARYDVALEYSPEPAPGAADTAGTDGPSVFTAVREQLGLKLEGGRGPVEFLVIEHAEKPGAN